MPVKKKLLFLFSDTGGGHRSSMEAVEEAINFLYPDKYVLDKVDFFKSYSPWPFNKAAELYPYLIKFRARPWEYVFNHTNNPLLFNKIPQALWPYAKSNIQKIFADHPSDLVVSFHHGINYYLKILNLPHVTVITDLITAHAAWYSGNPIKYFVPTEEIKNDGLKFGINPKKIVVTGLPISLKFKPKPQMKNEKWQMKNVLLMGGGQGMGKLYSIATSLNNSNLPIKLVVVAGRNPTLEKKLNALDWHITHQIYGFTKEIPKLMQEADILLTKAGPSTISEGLVSGLPIIIYDYLPGQETANVDYIVKNHAGFYRPTPKSLSQTLHRLINSINLISETSLHAAQLSQPQAALTIAQGLHQLVS